MDATYARRMEKEVHIGLSWIPAIRRNYAFKNYLAAVNNYPDCAAKQLLLKAFERCPMDNVLAFIAVTQITHARRIPFTDAGAMTLKDAEGQPVFFNICDELKPANKPDTRGSIDKLSRRMMLKTVIGGGLGFFALREVGTGGWVKKDAAGENDLDEVKIARFVAELVGTASAVHAADKDLAALKIEKTIRVIAPLVEKTINPKQPAQGL